MANNLNLGQLIGPSKPSITPTPLMPSVKPFAPVNNLNLGKLTGGPVQPNLSPVITPKLSQQQSLEINKPVAPTKSLYITKDKVKSILDGLQSNDQRAEALNTLSQKYILEGFNDTPGQGVKVIGDKVNTPPEKNLLQKVLTPAGRFYSGIADLGQGISETIDTGLTKLGVISDQTEKNKAMRTLDEGIRQEILGKKAGYEDTAQEVGRFVGSMAVTPPISRGLQGAKLIPRVLGGATEGLLGGASYNVSTGEGVGSPINLGLSTAIGGALPLVGPIVRGTSKLIKSSRNKIAEGIVGSNLKNPAMREKYIAKIGQTPEKTLLEEGIVGSLSDQAKQVSDKSSKAYVKTRLELQKISDKVGSKEGEWITSKLIEGIDPTIPGIEDIIAPVKGLNTRFKNGTASLSDLNDAKLMLARYEKIYDDFGRVRKTGDEFEKQAIAKMYNKMKTEIEDFGKIYGVDIEKLNKETQKREGLRGLMDRAVSREAGRDMISLSDYILGGITMTDPLTAVPLVLGKKIISSPKITSRIAKSLYTKDIPNVRNNNSVITSTTDRITKQRLKGLPLKPGATVFPGSKGQLGNTEAPYKPNPSIRETGLIGQPYKKPVTPPKLPTIINKTKTDVSNVLKTTPPPKLQAKPVTPTPDLPSTSTKNSFATFNSKYKNGDFGDLNPDIELYNYTKKYGFNAIDSTKRTEILRKGGYDKIEAQLRTEGDKLGKLPPAIVKQKVVIPKAPVKAKVKEVAKVGPVSKELQPIYEEARKYETQKQFEQAIYGNRSQKPQVPGKHDYIDDTLDKIDPRKDVREFDLGGGFGKDSPGSIKYFSLENMPNKGVYFPNGVPEYTIIYRGGKKGAKKLATLREGEYATINKNVASKYSGHGGEIKEYKVKTKDLIFDPKENGNDDFNVIYDPNKRLNVLEKLLKGNAGDIYKQANKPTIPKAPIKK